MSEGLALVIAKMMAKDPKARHQTPAQIVSDLEAFASASVPLPAAEEMPALSPAAMEGMGAEEEGEAVAGPAVAETPLNTAATVTAHAGGKSKEMAVLAGAAASPFGASSSASPWGNAPRQTTQAHPKPSSRPAMAPLPQPQARSGETPPAKRSGPFAPSNPFGGDAPRAKPAKKLPLSVVIGAVVAAVVLALLLAKLT